MTLSQPQFTDPLTDAEQRVLELMARGLSDKEIAAELYISPMTVRGDHKQHIYDKLGLQSPNRNKKHALLRANEMGLLGGESDQLSPLEQLLSLPIRSEHNLPTDLTPFVGREVEIAEVARLIDDPDHRLITILASGGMGKTRIAIEIARHYIGQFRDGVFLVSLQSLSDPENIASEIASSVDFSLQRGDAKQQVLQFLANKHMLLVFDNFEHLLDGTSILADIMSRASDVTMLVSSRERLHLSAETVYALPQMACPMDILQDLLKFDAVRLLIQSAQHIKTDWQLTDDNLVDVFRITQLTQGMPLGILLAMSWLDMMPIAEIADEIQCDIDFLSADLRDLPDRHQSVRAIFNGTWNRLSEPEQSALAKISIFRGGFTREALQTVTGANLRVLHSLTNKSLIQMDETGRYSIHELLRQFAEEQFNQRDDVDDARDAHMRYYAAWYIREGSSERVTGPDRLKVINLLDRDFENIQLMWARAQELEALDLIIDVLSSVSLFRGNTPRQSKPNAKLISDLMAYLQTQPSWNEAQERLYMHVCGRYQPNVHDISGAEHESNIQRGLVIAEKYGELKRISEFKSALSRRAVNQKDDETAKRLYEEALSVAYRLNDYRAITVALMARGYYLILAEGDLQNGGIANSLEIMQHAQQNGDLGMMSHMAFNLALPYHVLDEWTEARKWADEALKLSKNADDHEKQFDVFLFLQYYNIVFMNFAEVKLYTQYMKELAQYRNVVIKNWLVNFREGLSHFIQGRYSIALDLMMPWYVYRKKVGNPDGLNGAARWKALCDSQLGNFSECITDLIYIVPYDLKFSWNSHLIIDCMIFLPMLQDQGDDRRSVELIAMFHEHPKALPISNQHPYVVELEAQLQNRLDEDTYQLAWGRGAQLDPMVVALALMEKFTAIYGKSAS